MAFTEFGGYVIEAEGSTWLHEYRARWERPRWFRCVPAEFRSPVSGDLKAKFAVWAAMMKDAKRKKGRQELEQATLRADNMGKFLALLLRGEVGPGPAIIYIDQFWSPDGAREWQVTDDGALCPYRHVSSAGYVIDHQEPYGHWAGEYQPAGKYMMGTTVGEGERWLGERAIPRELVLDFNRWHEQWRTGIDAQSQDPGFSFDWDAHNAEGLALAHRLKQSLGAAYRVIYARPFEEPWEQKSWEAAELRMDGSHTHYVHAPYWTKLCDLSQSDGQC